MIKRSSEYYRELGKKGGAATKQKYGHDHYVTIGKKGAGVKRHRNSSTAQARLIAALEHAGVYPDLIDKARRGVYDSLHSTAVSPRTSLVHDLTKAGLTGLLKRVLDNDFEPSSSELKAWYASEEGQRLMKEAGIERS